MKRRSASFTLVELLVLLATVTILSVVMLPVLSRARAEARNTACQANLLQIGCAMGLYQADYDLLFPTSNNTPFTYFPEGWQCIWTPDGGKLNVDGYVPPSHILCRYGYLKVGWHDNRDRAHESVWRCPADRVGGRRIGDMHSFNACKRAHCAGGLTVSYCGNQALHANYFATYRDWSKKMGRPGALMLQCEYDWWNHPRWFAWIGNVRVPNRANTAAYALAYNNNLHAALERHGGGRQNILWADLHVSSADAFAWNSSQAFQRYDSDGVSYPAFSPAQYFYWPLFYGPL